jgi:hypothetical protein
MSKNNHGINLNVPNLIKTENYYNSVSHIKNYEDMLTKIFKSKNKSSLIYDKYVYLWKNDNELFPNLQSPNLLDFGLNENLDNIVITGPYIRSCLLNILDNSDKNIKIRNEVYLYKYDDRNWSDIISDLSEYEENENEFFREIRNKKIYVIKQKYISPSHIILQHDYIKRIGWENGIFYTSSMFLIDFQKHKNLLTENFKDPILNIPYDPLFVYQLNTKQLKQPIRIIEFVDIDEFNNLSDKNITKIYDNKTYIELCIDKYMLEEHSLLLENLEKMILYLLKYLFIRPAYFYAKIMGLHLKNPKLYKTIAHKCDKKYKYLSSKQVINTPIMNIMDINNYIIDVLIMNDLADDLMNYMLMLKISIGKNFIDSIIKYKAKNITNAILKKNILDKYFSYYLTLMTENIEIMNTENFDIETAINFLKDIVINGMFISFNYLLEKDKSVINTTFPHNRNIMHIIKNNGDYQNIIKKVYECNPELFYLCDDFGECPIIYHSKNNPQIFNEFIKYDIDLTVCDIDENMSLHHLCKQNEPSVLRNFLKKYSELINITNNVLETPIMIACKNKQEDMFYILKGHNADLCTKDNYGNTAYHYICANGICLGMTILNIQNYFGIYPIDYCKISPNYYDFE